MTFRPDFISYDLMTADDRGAMAKAFVDGGHEPMSSEYGVSRLTEVRQLPARLGL
jgi:2-haloacid dehalogenase